MYQYENMILEVISSFITVLYFNSYLKISFCRFKSVRKSISDPWEMNLLITLKGRQCRLWRFLNLTFASEVARKLYLFANDWYQSELLVHSL